MKFSFRPIEKLLRDCFSNFEPLNDSLLSKDLSHTFPNMLPSLITVDEGIKYNRFKEHQPSNEISNDISAESSGN